MKKMKFLILSIYSIFSVQALAQRKAYIGVVNKADQTASFINAETGKTEFTVQVGYFPHEIVTSTDGRYAFVSNYGKDHVRSQSPANRPGSTITVIDIENRRVETTLQLGEKPCAPHGMAISKDNQTLYVTCEARNEMMVLSWKNSLRHFVIPTGQEQSHMVVLSPDEKRAYTSNFSAGSISVLDLENRTLLKVVSVGRGIEGISVSQSGRYIFASSVLDNYFVKLDAETFEVLAKVSTERSPVRILPTPDDHKLIVNCSASNVVQIFAEDSLQLLHTVAVGRQPIGLVVSSADYALTAPMLENKILKINLNEGRIERTYETGVKPDGVSFSTAK